MSNESIDRRRRLILQAIGTLPLAAGMARADAQPRTIRKPIPSSGELIPVIGLGTSGVFEVGESAAERQGPLETLAVLQRLGNAVVDTSPMYDEAEQVIGELLPALPSPSQFFLATKVWTRGRNAGIAQMNNSFRLLGTDVIDLMQIHNLLDWHTHILTLREWKQQGRIRHIGITHYRDDAHDDLARVIRQLPDLDFVQLNYSLLEPAAENWLLPLCAERGIAVIANRPFVRGGWFSLTRGKTLPAWARELGIQSWAQFALKWVVSHPAISCTIPGTGKARHMLDNIQAGAGDLLDARTRAHMQQFIRSL